MSAKKIYFYLSVLVFFFIVAWGVNWFLDKNYFFLNKNIDNLEITLYTKQDCVFCKKAETLLKNKNIKFTIIDITNKPEIHLALVKETKQYTVPVVFVNHKFLGGYRELKAFLRKAST